MLEFFKGEECDNNILLKWDAQMCVLLVLDSKEKPGRRWEGLGLRPSCVGELKEHPHHSALKNCH